MYGGQYLPKFGTYVTDNMHTALDSTDPAQPDMDAAAPNLNHAFLEELGSEHLSRRSFAKWERIMHSHGACLEDVWQLRYEKIPKLCDVVVYPGDTPQVERLVKLAQKHNVVLVPYGGGTNVTKSLKLNMSETRMIVSVDMGRMNRVKWVDKENNLACVGAGIMGQDLERDLMKYGVCTGHEPDSQEYSTMGGWVSTRASGMKKNTYGNIEDMLVRVKMVTAVGTIDRAVEVPRLSMGPDIQHLVLGSEGSLGVVTEAVLRMRRLPEKQKYGSLIFPALEAGVNFMREVAKPRAAPSSIRLVDNEQFQFGLALKPEQKNPFKPYVDGFKKFYVTKWHGFEPLQMCVATVMLEGTAAEIAAQKRRIYGCLLYTSPSPRDRG